MKRLDKKPSAWKPYYTSTKARELFTRATAIGKRGNWLPYFFLCHLQKMECSVIALLESAEGNR